MTGPADTKAIVLQSLRRDLRETIVPDLSSANAKLVATLMDEMLGWLALDPPLAVSVSGSKREQVRAEADRLAEEFELSEALSRRAGEPIDQPVTAQALDGWLASCFPGAGLTTSLTQIVGGFSKDTWMASLSGEIAGFSEIVIRRDLPFGPGENSVVDEYGILLGLFSQGIQVPEPLALEEGREPLGTPFLVFPRLAGKAIFDDWADAPDRKQSVANQVAEMLARFHAVAPGAVGIEGTGMHDAVGTMVAEWRGKWERRRPGASAIVDAAFDWLEENVPVVSDRAAIIHGDVSFRNTLLSDDRLVALLDWEFAHLGDPAEDVGYFRLVAEPHVDWDEVMECYHSAGGAQFDPQRAAYYEVWRSTRNAVTTATAWHGLVNGLYAPSKAAFQGLSLYRFFLRDIADKLEPML